MEVVYINSMLLALKWRKCKYNFISFVCAAKAFAREYRRVATIFVVLFVKKGYYFNFEYLKLVVTDRINDIDND